MPAKIPLKSRRFKATHRKKALLLLSKGQKVAQIARELQRKYHPDVSLDAVRKAYFPKRSAFAISRLQGASKEEVLQKMEQIRRHKERQSAHLKRLNKDPKFAAERDRRWSEMNAAPEFVEAKANRLRDSHNNPAFEQKRLNALKKRHNEPEFASAFSERMRKVSANLSPEQVVAKSKKARSFTEDPEINARRVARLREKHTDPDYIKRRLDAIQRYWIDYWKKKERKDKSLEMFYKSSPKAKELIQGTKIHAVWKLSLEAPDISAEDALKRLKRRGLNVSKNTWSVFRSRLRERGLLPWQHTLLDSKEAELRKTLHYNRGKQTAEELALKFGLTAKQIRKKINTMQVQGIRVRLKRKSIRLKSTPELTPAQEKLLEQARTFADIRVSKLVSMKKLFHQEREDFRQEIDRHLYSWVKSFSERKGKKSSLYNWIIRKSNYFLIDYIRRQVQHGTGLSLIEVKLIGALRKRLKKKQSLEEAVRGINKLKDYSKTMRRAKSKFSEGRLTTEIAEELLDVYNLYEKQSKVNYFRNE